MNETILLMTIIHLLFALTMILIRFIGYLFISSSFIQYLNLVCPLVLIDMKLNHVTYLGGVIQTACIFFPSLVQKNWETHRRSSNDKS